MDKDLQIPAEYTIRFQTAPITPAPFSHFYTLRLDVRSAIELWVDFGITYTERDEMSEEDLIDEGFTANDDYHWSGKVPPVWINEFGEIFGSSKMIRKREEVEYEDFIEIELEENNKNVTIYPVDKERWTYFLQEFMQAIFEASGKEKPFEMTYLEIGDGQPFTLDLKASFATKMLTLSKLGEKPQQLDWPKLQKIMDTVYRADFLADMAARSRPNKPGKYITAGDGLWYQLGVSIVESAPKSKDLPKIDALFVALRK
ncbi:hypothetical protein [Dyadobacter sandarakinus]|uniref:Uncharacterized protein n=1 Tax=Dyadobacter sandarakinus TaxID=2747268 RepID=A0ABX7I2H4_9BACT|nr:hypothetical protein [Dyadobacter sandarakinus]QRQ99922.1 hypothetical protein HWI92_02820 [Dyadobacter sandarakinus]